MAALLRLGSKSCDAFRREGQSWHCTSGLPSDLSIEVGQVSFHLHKFPLLSRSGLLKKLIADSSSSSSQEEGATCVVQLHDIPGGDKTFDLVTRFCYGVLIQVSASNVVPLRCAAEYLQMDENYGESNLIRLTHSFLNDQVLTNWLDTIIALQTCQDVMPYAQQLNIVTTCIDFLTLKACPDTNTKDHKPQTKADDDHWWYEDLSLLSLPLYKTLILSIQAKGMKPENIAGSLIHYITRHVPLMNRQSSFDNEKNNNNNNNNNVNQQGTNNSEADQRCMLEDIVEMLPNKKGVTPSKYLLRMLTTAMVLHANQSCIDNLEKRIGSQLEQAMLVDLLIPNMGQSAETLYDTDCIQRIIDHFLSIYLPATASTSPCISIMNEQGPLANAAADSLTPMTIVANLIDAYLAEVALDVNLKLPKFQALATAIPEYARPMDDGLYHAIDVYLKAHHWLVDSEREQFCRLMNCQKLSLEASTHAAQNERLPLRVIVQVLFFEQLRLRTSISSWLFDDNNNFDNSHQQQNNLNLAHLRTTNNGQVDPSQQQGGGNLKERVSELEKECTCIRKELHKLVKTKRGWNIFQRMFFRKRSNNC
ncbi:hypothetical protein PIB30_015849 [Stylosanthes scabra]|uniref:Phototropic-responsive NPH3 family protein n=1 Tax=Stylosanthes scabra TaxID=79078 RepID=A0ABU6R7H4_9FABA|nr:hypothetical protein [Stylosanthes scabra]